MAFCSGGKPNGAQRGKVGGEKLPILLHFDVNKTVIQSDIIQMKSCEEGAREGIAELFWGTVRKDGEKISKWDWSMTKPSCSPPDDSGKKINYAQYCKLAVKDKKDVKHALKYWGLVEGEPVRVEMEKLLSLAMKRMQLPPEVVGSAEAEAAGLKGPVYCMFPSLFHLVSHLQRTKRVFAILFRSFGADHEKIQLEWNAFCEMRHPIFSKLIHDIGPMDGSVSNVPDRRIHGLHTLYRDEKGTLLLLDTFTNGPPDNDSWDAWAKKKPKADTRDGRKYIQQVLKAKVVDGIPAIQKWMKQHISSGATAAIKDDWAWWQFHGEQAHAGKLLAMLPNVQQMFFDDNVGHTDARIVDCRDFSGNAMPFSKTNGKICVKVNPVEALLDDDYFLRMLQTASGDTFDTGTTLMRLHKQLVDVEEERTTLQKQVNIMTSQLHFMAEETKRLKLLRRVKIPDEAELQSLIAKEIDMSLFDRDGSRSMSELFAELDAGYCWLERTEAGKIIRVLDMLFLRIYYKDFILVEATEQDFSGKTQSRNYLPGVVVTLRDTPQTAMERWVKSGLTVDLTDHLHLEKVPTPDTDAPPQVTGAAQAYPIACVIQNSQASFIVQDVVELMSKEAMKAIGLPEGKHFTTKETDMHGGTVVRNWKWDKRAVFEAGVSNAAGAAGDLNIDPADECDKLFRGHPRCDAYSRILLEMFDIFKANLLCGGFSGSIVIRVQPYIDGRMGDACIVKLDAGEAIREEVINSENVFNALPDRAAKMLGAAVYKKNAEGEEFGAMRLELAGACWNNPELAQGSGSMLFTFKDLLLYESENIIIGGVPTIDEVRPFGVVNSILAETFGPGGVVASLRKGGAGLRRANGQPLVWGWYTLKGKDGKFNPYTAKKGEYAAADGMRAMYKKSFGGEMPPLKDLVQGKIKPQLESMSKLAKNDLCPLIGLAHGDLNAANIMIDPQDAVWLIDFATSVDLPLFTDMCKFEMACLFEYSTIPLTPIQFLEFCGPDEASWTNQNVGDWIKIDTKLACLLLQKFVAKGEEQLAEITESELLVILSDVVNKSGKKPEKKLEIMRSLRARFTHDVANTTAALNYAREVTKVVLEGTDIKDCLDMKTIPMPEGKGSRGASSLRFFMDTCVSIRRFMLQDISGLLRDIAKGEGGHGGVQFVDYLALQLWLPFLRESFRIIGYRDVPPQFKTWVIYHCGVVAKVVQSNIEVIGASINKLNTLPLFAEAQRKLADRGNEKQNDKTIRSDMIFKSDPKDYAVDSFMLYSKRVRSFGNGESSAFLRKLHAADPVVKNQPGYYAPIWEVRSNGSPSSVTYKNSADEVQPPGSWELSYKEPFVNGVGQEKGEKGARVVHLGWMLPSKPTSLVLSSRLFYIPSYLMKKKSRASNEEEEVAVANESAFSLQAWTSSGSSKDPSRAVRVTTPSVTNAKGFYSLFLALDIDASDAAGNLKGKFTLQLGAPTVCYPIGSNLSMDMSIEGLSAWPLVTIVGLQEGGQYRVCNAATMAPDSEFDLDPDPVNHTFHSLAKYQVDDRLLMVPDKNSESEEWLEGLVLEPATPENRCKFKLQVKGGDETVRVVDTSLNYMISGRLAPSLTASVFEEELVRFKAFFNSRYSFIVDSLSGQRISVKDTAPPTLKVVRDTVWGEGSGSRSFTKSGGGSAGKKKPSANAAPTGDEDKAEQSPWGQILGNLDSFEKGLLPGGACSYLVIGSPGSGKTCIVMRVINEILDRCSTLIPLLLPVADMIKRSSESVDNVDVYDWFDKYLRITFGEDSNRYNMIVQGLKMRRVVMLFEGLEDGGALTNVIESIITKFVTDRHLCIITSRPLLGGQSSLEKVSEHIVAVNVQNLSDEHKRLVAQRRLGLNGIDFYDRLFAKLKEGSTENATADGDDADESDVFGNPMMLSMLLCYIQTTQRKLQEKRDEAEKNGEPPPEEGDGLGGASLTAVYRVAMEVMLARVQSKSQADRFNKDEKIEQCKRILNIMAKHMHLQRRLEIGAHEVEALLPSDLVPQWQSLFAAAEAGHAMFLRVLKDKGTTELRFLVKGFQAYFCAMASVQDGGAQLPPLVALLAEPWWAQMLEMLAEAKPGVYVQVVETRLKEFKPVDGDDYLHIAARAGHRPIFQLIRMLNEENRKGIFSKSKDLSTPLHVAAARGNMRICNMLLDVAANPQQEDANGRLPIHAAMQHGFFQTAKMLLERVDESGSPPVSRHTLNQGEGKAQKLAEKVLGGMTEVEFLGAIDNLFVELGYFSDLEAMDKKRTLGALLAVFWITANDYEGFVRSQPPEQKLTKESWLTLQDWTKNSVQLTNSTETMGAMLVFAAIINLGKIKPFRKVFVPAIDEPTEALYAILSQYPMVVPSFSKLQPHLRQTIISSLKADFNFGQFLQAENLPASLLVVKQILGDDGEGGSGGGGAGSVNILGFFLFRIFAAMCGILGMKSNEGSLFMTNSMYGNFKRGLDALQTLDKKTCDEVYDSFLAERAKTQGLTFKPGSGGKERAIVRLACLTRVFDPAGGKEVAEAFAALLPEERNELTEMVNADGLSKKGFLCYNAPAVIENARKNASIGLTLGLRMLLSVYKKAAVEYEQSSEKVVTILMDEMAARAQKCQDAESFLFTKFEIRKAAGVKGTVYISPWQLVTDKTILENLTAEASALTNSLSNGTVREPVFLKKVASLFPELNFMKSDGKEYEDILSETLCGLLVIFWLSMGQVDPFTRGQEKAKKLSEKSWNALYTMNEEVLGDQEIVNAVLSVMSIRLVGRMAKFREQLAPQAQTQTQVLEQVFETCPAVLVSYQRLSSNYRSLARECLTRDLWFRQFLRAEVIPASLQRVKEMFSAKRGSTELSADIYCKAYQLCVVAELGASKGKQTLEGSLYLDEERFQELMEGLEVLRQLERKSEQEVYMMYLEKRAKRMDMEFSASSSSSVALVRLACLCQGAKDHDKVGAAFDALSVSERSELAQHLCSDGITQQGFVVSEAHAFMQKASENGEVGLISAVRILLVLYQAAKKEFGSSKETVVNIRLDKLVEFTVEFKGSVSFQELSFDLVRMGDKEALVVPKSWIPVKNQVVLDALNETSLTLCKKMLARKVGEKQFRAGLSRTYPELGYFGDKAKEKYDQTIGALLAIFWLTNNQYEAFVRNQPEDNVLTKQSWQWLQKWLKESVCLFSEAQLDAALTSLAIHALTKIPEFREELAPGFDKSSHDAALAHILDRTPEIVPSFNRLQDKYKSLIKDCLSTDFSFEQFLAAENLPGNLLDLKDRLSNHGDMGMAFFCFRIFAQLCGKYGSHTGATFMTESQFQRFLPGLHALLHLQTVEPGQAYNTFLLAQGSKGLSRFAAPEHHALTRLLCLSAAFDLKEGDSVCQAFSNLKPGGRRALTRWLTADGITSRPGYVLSDFSEFLRNAQANKAVGLSAALRMLVRVQEECDASNSWASWEPLKVCVHLADVAAWAKDAGPSRDVFEQARLIVEQEDWKETRNFYVSVVRPDVTLSASAEGHYGRKRGACERCRRCMACFFILLVILLMFASSAAAVYTYLYPQKVLTKLDEHGISELDPMQLEVGFAGIALFCFLVLACCCLCRSGCARGSPSGSRYTPLMICEQESRYYSAESEPFLCNCSGGRGSDDLEAA